MKPLALGSAVLLSSVFALAVPPSAADLLRAPDYARVAMSPDGKHVLLMKTGVGKGVILHDTATHQKRTLNTEVRDRPSGRNPPWVMDAQWLGSSRLLLGYNSISFEGRPMAVPGSGGTAVVPSMSATFSGFAVMDLTEKNWVALPGMALRADRLPPGIQTRFSWDTRRLHIPLGEDAVILAPAYDGAPGPRPYIVQIDPKTGKAARLMPNPGTVTEWLFDRTKRAALGVNATGPTVKLLGLERDGATWKDVGDLGEPRQRVRLLGLDAARGLVYASKPGPTGRWAPAVFKLRDGQWSSPLGANERYDVAPAAHAPLFAALDLTDVLFSPKTGLPLGLGYMSDRPQQEIIDPRFKAALTLAGAGDPGLVTHIISVDLSEQRALTLSWSARQPGFYSFVDLEQQRATRIAERMPWLRSEDLGEMQSVTLISRDGVELDGYLTLPPATEAKNLPTVLLLRDRPWQRDLWGFNALAQFFATRGYAVLQVNPRGTTGYGEAFFAAGRDDPTGRFHDDLIDAARWAISQRVADPRRIAVVGSGFGANCGLIALAREPELFRCGAAVGPVVDWNEVAANKDSNAYRFWFEAAGVFSAQTTKDVLRAASPIHFAAKLKNPVFLAQADSDSRLASPASGSLPGALKRAGNPPETFFYSAAPGDTAQQEKKRIETYERIATFLAKYLTPVAADTTATPPRS